MSTPGLGAGGRPHMHPPPACDHDGLVPYLSAEVAGNAVDLHALANAACAGVHTFPCGDHWHIGHDDRDAGAECRAAAAAALEDRHARRTRSTRPRRRGRR